MDAIETKIETKIETNDLVSGAFEACGGFASPPDWAPTCERCGWLDAEHAAVEAMALRPNDVSRASCAPASAPPSPPSSRAA